MGHAELAPTLLSPEEYLAGEMVAESKHEYVAGVVYAMAGGPARHHRIATNALVALGGRLRGKKCQPFNSDMLVRVRMATHTRFYYPDVQVVCRPAPPDQLFQDEPSVIIEVISESSRRTDEQEKREAYLSINSVDAYILLEQKGAAATVWRRTSSGFKGERWEGTDTVIPLGEIDASLPLAEVYDGVEFPSASEEDPLLPQ
ncbi:MAG TPA: Uma2 family endonuclease [Chthoniobacteraceae bacterium]|jgi:Uma2 family endonuclease